MYFFAWSIVPSCGSTTGWPLFDRTVALLLSIVILPNLLTIPKCARIKDIDRMELLVD